MFAFPGVLNLKFEKDIAALRPQGLEALDVQEDLLNAFGAGRQYVLASWLAEDMDAFWKKGRVVEDTLDKLKKSGMINEWASLGQISSKETPYIEGIELNKVNELFKKYGLDLHHFPETHDFLTRISGAEIRARSKSEENTGRQSCEDLKKLPNIFNPYIVCEEGLFRGMAWIMVPEEKAIHKVSDELKKSCEELIVANPDLAVDQMVKEVRNELEITLGAAFLIVMGILVAFFRKPLALPLVFMPVIMGLFLTAGIMGWAGVTLNPFNFIVLPILVGIGLDDGIHIFRRYRDIGDIHKTLSTTGRSVLVTTLTTVCGFGSLSMANYHVLESMGIMTIVGVVACFGFSVITLPAILKILESGNS
jgi:predicted RND superfamily exporter protein